MFRCQVCDAESLEGLGPDENLCPECTRPALIWATAELPDWNPLIRTVLASIIEQSPRLMDSHRHAMRMRHGFAPYKRRHTYEEVAEESSLPRERVRQIDMWHVQGELGRRLDRLGEMSQTTFC
jgi:hypothetical protein